MAVVSFFTFVDPHTIACGKSFDDADPKDRKAILGCRCSGNIRPEAYRLTILFGGQVKGSGPPLAVIWSEWLFWAEWEGRPGPPRPVFVGSLGGNT